MPRNALVWQDLQAANNWELGNAATKRLLWSPLGFSRIGRGGELLHDPTDGPHTHSIYLAQSNPRSLHGH